MISRNTRQKEIIIREVNNIDTFFNSRELYDKVKKIDRKIGVATVYRILNNLKKKNLLHSYLCDRKTIYSNDKNNHCHFTCIKCGKTFHLAIKSIDFLKKNINGSICHFQVNIDGICDKCKKY